MHVEILEPRCMLAAAAVAAETPVPQPLARRSASGNWAALWFNGTKTRVGFATASGKEANIRPGRATWVVIHGWTDDLAATRHLAASIDRTSRKDQVVIVDWSLAAAPADVITATLRVPTVAQWAARTLALRGIAPGQINLVGHSLGGYLADQVARKTPGGVSRIIALDAATPDVGGIDLGGADFAARSRFSIAFVASSFASRAAALTADETIRVDVGPFDSILSHAAVGDLFATMVVQGISSRPGRLSGLFSVKRLSLPARPRWKHEAFAGGYDVVLTGGRQDGHYSPTSLRYVPRHADTALTIGP